MNRLFCVHLFPFVFMNIILCSFVFVNVLFICFLKLTNKHEQVHFLNKRTRT
ncbi:hypothetical protein HanXRQr2_Chr08g0320271 [Helianthus annuus]|uniref:Uncharacterized protein n=1 Tax=Helianthus annuus TaxID=4232 RepID=A0A9K3NAY3_HELAN|nr:hypothetical protein HanXRQr2_Chr08g0320271 [Helianthus annuus]